MTRRPRLLDLFAGAGGAARGYQLAGFHVTGVDIKPQPRYAGDEFHQADALTFPLHGFDAIHASPPCQAYTQASNRWRGRSAVADGHPELVAPIRERIKHLPYVIENVMGARWELVDPVLLHGGMFGLGVHRPRLFEVNFAVLRPPQPLEVGRLGVYGAKPDGRRLNSRNDQRCASSVEEAREAMGINWMEWRELCEAIPPAYSEFLGGFLFDHLRAEGSAA